MRILASTIAALLLFALSASADSVLIRGGGILSPNNVNTFYNGQGHASSVVNTVTAADLVGQDLLIIWGPTAALTGTELTAMTSYLALGNKIAFFGENKNFPGENTNINAAITTLGGSMQINPGQLIDNGLNNATTGGGQILPHPLTSGLNLIQYGGVSGVAGIAGGNGIFLTQDLATVWAGTEAAGGGSLLLVADSNLETFLLNPGAFPPGFNDNGQLFLNLLSENFVGAGDPIPEPGTFVLFGLAAAGAYVLRRRRKAS